MKRFWMDAKNTCNTKPPPHPGAQQCGLPAFHSAQQWFSLWLIPEGAIRVQDYAALGDATVHPGITASSLAKIDFGDYPTERNTMINKEYTYSVWWNLLLLTTGSVVFAIGAQGCGRAPRIHHRRAVRPGAVHQLFRQSPERGTLVRAAQHSPVRARLDLRQPPLFLVLALLDRHHHPRLRLHQAGFRRAPTSCMRPWPRG